MPDHSSASIRPPKDWQDFERNSRILFECILKDPGVKNNGIQGQRQNGVDLYGRPDGKGTAWVGVQCKGKKAEFGKKVTKKELRKEASEARKFKPPLKRFILITTAADDAVIEEEARLITQEHQEKGISFSVEVWGWDTLEGRISEHSRALKAFTPDSTPFSDEILKNQAEIKDKNSEILDNVKLLLQTVQGTKLSVVGDSTSAALEAVDKILHATIDGYRDLLLEGKPLTALKLLERLKEREWESASDRIKFRIITNIGSAKLHISKEKEAEAIEHFLEAIKYQPDDKVALANVALAYLLKGEVSKAITAALRALEKDPENAEAASYLIQAHIKDTAVDNPVELVPESIRQSASVDLASIHFYRERHDSRWSHIAKEACKRHPNTDQIIRFAAEAELENAVNTKGLLNGQQPILPIDREALQNATAALQKLWDKQYHSELPHLDSSLPYNLAQLYRTVEDEDSAKIVITQALEKMPEASDLIKLRAGFYLQDRQPQQALSLLKKSSSDPESLLLSAEILAKDDPVAALNTLENFEQIEGVEQHHRMMAGHLRVGCWLAHPKLSQQDRVKKAEGEYSALLTQCPENSLTLLLHSQILEAAGEYHASKQVLDRAKTLLKSESPFYERFMLARKFETLEKYADVAEILDGHVDQTHDSSALRMWFLALINSDCRSRAYRLLSAMPTQVAEQPLFLRAAISLHLRRGDYPLAENAANKLLEINPEDLRTHLDRVEIWLRHRNDAAVKRFLSTEVEELKGEPHQIIKLAHLLHRFGFYERALKLGYKTLLESPKNHDIQLAYMALLLSPGASEKINLQRTIIEVDTAFSIKNTLGETETFIIEDDESLRSLLNQAAISCEHPFATAATGLKEEQKFQVKGGEEWEIIFVKHKYLHALHSSMEHFDRYFPESGHLQRFIIRQEDGETSIEPILQKTKEKHDFIKKILDAYSELPLPLELFAEYLGGDVIDAWGGLARMGHNFKVCNGNDPERGTAKKCIVENRRSGCVVDALTLHLIRIMGIEEAVTAVCGPIAATASTIDTFRDRREQILSHAGQSYMTIYWWDGQYFREEITSEQLDRALASINAELDWMEQNVEILPAESARPISTEAERIRDAVSYVFLDPLLAAQEANKLLLCEDQSYRQFGVTEFKIKASWLQPVLMLAIERGAISRAKYCDAINILIEARHNFTSIDASLLFYTLKHRESRFKVIAGALFGVNAEIHSHLRVMITFLDHIWRSEHRPFDELRATNTLLERFCFGEWTSNVPNIDPYTILSSLKNTFTNSYFNKYLSQWQVGHFLTRFGDNAQNTNP